MRLYYRTFYLIIFSLDQIFFDSITTNTFIIIFSQTNQTFMKIGCHLSISKGIERAILNVPALGGNALQIYISPRHGAGGGIPLSDEDAEDIQDLLIGSKIYMVVHGKLDLNFCDSSVKWYKKALIQDLQKAGQISGDIGVVIHQGKNVDRFNLEHSDAVKNYVKRIIEVLEETKDLKNPIFLENSAHQGTELGYDLPGLAEIWKEFPSKYHSRLGICLDTCHAFVAGALQMKDNREVDNFMKEFDKLIGLQHLKVIHYNDSKTPFDGRNDHHHDIGAGYITNQSYQSTVQKYQASTKNGQNRGTEEGLKRVLAWAKVLNIPCILETPEEATTCSDQLKTVNQWAESFKSSDLPTPPK